MNEPRISFVVRYFLREPKCTGWCEAVFYTYDMAIGFANTRKEEWEIVKRTDETIMTGGAR